MNILHKKNTKVKQTIVPNMGENIISIIDANTKIEGSVSSTSELRIHGKIEGDVSTANIYLGRQADCSGTINAENSIISGKFDGNITSGHLEVKSTAIMLGEITQNSIMVEVGAKLDVKIQSRAK